MTFSLRIPTTYLLIRHLTLTPRRFFANRNILKLSERKILQNVIPRLTPDFEKQLIGEAQTIYCGFDPTAESLHIGNLLVLICLLHCQRAGHSPIVLIGGATARIGDPSGKNVERPFLSDALVETNVTKIREKIDEIFANHEWHFWKNEKHKLPALRIVNNADWYQKRNVIDFMSKEARHVRMGDLLSRTNVKSRIESPEGLSLNEFSYQLFQAYDWYHLFQTYGCAVQLGGNDQTGNMQSGHDFIKRATGKSVFGLTVPLVKSSTGDKLGKSAGNAVWLSAAKTSPFELFQFLRNTPDADVEQMLTLFTFDPMKEIADLMKRHKAQPELYQAQMHLAQQVVLLIHGEAGLESARRCTAALFLSSAEALAGLSADELQSLYRGMPTTELLLESGLTLLDLVMKAKCFPRREDAERVIQQGGVSINHRRIQQANYVLVYGEHVLPSDATLIRVGKKNFYLVRWKKDIS